MKPSINKYAFLLISIVIQGAAVGEPGLKVFQPRTTSTQVPNAELSAPQQQAVQEAAGGVVKQAKPVRRVASVSNKSNLSARARRGGYYNPYGTDIRLFLFGGMSNMSTANAAVQGNRDEQKIGSNILAGLGADLRMEKYFGAELDGYYGIAPTQTIIFDEQETQKKKIQHTGVMANAKLQYPTYLSGNRVIPKVGLGYGMLGLKQTTESQLFADTYEGNESIKGVYGTIGFDFEPVSWLVLTADYATSLSASGTYKVSSQTINSDSSLTGAKFDRIRVGALFRVSPGVMLGGYYIRRSLSYSGTEVAGEASDTADSGSVTGSVDTTSVLDLSNAESVSQIAAVLLFQF